MKKLLSMITALAIAAACAVSVNAGGAGEEIPVDNYLTGKGNFEYVEEDYGYYVADTNTVLKINMPVDIIRIYNDEEYGCCFSYGAEDGVEVIEESSDINIEYTTDARVDSKDWWEMNVGDDLVEYIQTGATIQFLNPGSYMVGLSIGFESGEDRIAYIEENGGTDMAPMDGFFTVKVEEAVGIGNSYDDVFTNSKGEVIGGEDFSDEVLSDEPGYYNESFMSISNVSEYEYGTIIDGWYTANCGIPTEVTGKKEFKNFIVIKLEYIDGEWLEYELVEPNGNAKFAENGYMETEPGVKYVITEPGYYSVWAEDYDGNFDGIYINAENGAAAQEAVYTSSKVMVNGEEVKFEAYNIKGNNYFKLRDIAKALNGSEKQFEVSWDNDAQRIDLIPGAGYTTMGGELAAGDGTNKTAGKGTSDISLSGEAVKLSAYLINDNNYFKLRDLGEVFDFGVEWDGENNCVMINTSAQYSE